MENSIPYRMQTSIPYNHQYELIQLEFDAKTLS